jgi:hypothetical protein
VITLKWSSYTDANCDTFQIYRAIPGFVIDFPVSGIVGTTLRIQATSPEIQAISISSDTPVGVASELNAGLLGISATVSEDGTQVLVRAKASKGPRIRVYPCTFVDAVPSLSPRIIMPDSEWTLVGSVARAPGTDSYTFEDPDGQFTDSYRLSTVTGAAESVPSVIAKPFIPSPDVCLIEGRLISLGNRPLQNALIRIRPYLAEDSADTALVHGGAIKTHRSDTYGRFRLEALQGHCYLLEIPAIGYNQVVEVPETNWVDMTSLASTSQHWFSPGGGDPI